jgi:hypothetical protein
MMIRKSGPPRKISVTKFLLMRDERGMGRYRKSLKREPEEKAILFELALRKIERAERDNFIPVGFRRRRVNFL